MKEITQRTASLYSILESMRKRKRQRCFTSSVGPPSSICSLGSRIFYLLFFQSELVAYWVKIEFGAHQKRPYDIVSNRTVQTSRCSLSSGNSHPAGMAEFRIDLSSVQQKTRIQIILLLVLPSSICVLHLPMLLDSLQLAISTSPR